MIWLLLYIGSIVAANWAFANFAPAPLLWIGPVAPAGVYFVGLTFTLRDAAQDALGRRAVLVAVVGGALLSALLTTPALGLASGAAFLVSELADFAVYTPLRRRNLIGAVVASNAVGLVVDSSLFLWLAFGSLDFLFGQVAGKALLTVLALPVVALWARRRRAHEVEDDGMLQPTL